MRKADTVNTFQEGMIMDLNPLVTPNNVLTNCLNGTITTFNGNENVLQNDMGNGRVETAFLPEGYVPLGTAELGGIIYIVSYNPLINKCQVGSFPSPERNVTNEEISSSQVSVSNSQFQQNGKILNTVVKVKLLASPQKDQEIYKLNPGDKFAIYSTNLGIESNKDTISDVGTGSTYVDENPKYVTIHVVSIGEDGKITYLDDILKWDSNLQYYIKDCNKIDGIKQDLDEYRSLVSSAYNIFNSKVSGELALLFELKTIDSFSITWDANVSENNLEEKDKSANVLFDVNWTSGDERINVSRIVLSQSEFSQGFQKLDSPVQEGDSCQVSGFSERKNDGSDSPVQVSVGDFKYSSKGTLSDYVWNYQITPAMPFGELDYLSVRGTINFAEIGSGKIALDEWRYYIQENGFYLNWGLSAYPEKNKKIKKVIFTFIPFENITKNIKTKETEEYSQGDGFPQYIVADRNSYSGNFQEILNFGKTSRITGEGINPNHLYLVDVCVKYGKNETTEGDRNIHTYRWLYTTPQWNDAFLKGSESNFDNLSLKEVLNFKSTYNYKDNITQQTFTNYPSLNLNDDPGDGGEYTSMGVKTLTVNYDQKTNKFNSQQNVGFSMQITPTKYTDLFEFDNSQKDITYNNSVKNKFISHSDIEISSDKTSGIASAVEPAFSESFPSNFESAISVAINNNIDQTTNKQLVDSFNAEIVGNSNSNTVNLCVKGAIFSRINSDLISKTMTIGQRVRPILYSQDDYDSLGFDPYGQLKYYFLEGHKDLGGGKPFCFKFGYRNLNSTSDITSDQSSKGYWNPSDEFSRNTYWDDTKPYTEWLNPWMKAAQGPFQVLQYGIYMGKSTKFKGVNGDTELNNKYGLWVKTNNGHFMPINAFWNSTESRTTISRQLRAILMQIYYVETDVTSTSKYIVDNINVPNAYTETWNISIATDVAVNSMNKAIALKYSDGRKTLYDLQQILKDVSGVTLTAIGYGERETLSVESEVFQHTFRITMNDLYSIYENNKSTSIPAIYEVSTKSGSEMGTAVNANNLYVYNNGNKTFVKLSKQNSSLIYSDGEVTGSTRLVLKTSGTSRGSLDICNMILMKDGELCFDEDRLLANSVNFRYSTGDEGATYKGNSRYGFVVGTKYN